MNILVVDDQRSRFESVRRVYGPEHEYQWRQTVWSVLDRDITMAHLIMLDHDMCEGEGDICPRTNELLGRCDCPTGADVAKRIVECVGWFPMGIGKPEVLVHSSNPVGAQRIMDILNDGRVPARRVSLDGGKHEIP